MKTALVCALVVCLTLTACAGGATTPSPGEAAPAVETTLTSQAPTAPTTAPTPDIASIVSALSPVVWGQGVAGAPAYDPDAPGPHHLLLLTTSGATADWSDYLPTDWLPSSAGEVELVVLIGAAREILLGSQPYHSGTSQANPGGSDVFVGRYRFEVDVELREAHSGQTLVASTFVGADPIPFPLSTHTIRLDGPSVGYTTLEDWICATVRGQGCRMQIRTLDLPKGGVHSLAYSPEGRTLASGSWDGTTGTAILWDTATWTMLKTRSDHSGEVNGVAFSPDGRTLASAGSDGTIALWDVATDGPSRTLVAPDAYRPVKWLSVAFSPDGRTLASGSHEGWTMLWDAGSGEMVRTLHEDILWPVQGVAFAPDGSILANGSSNGDIVLRDAAGDETLRTLEGNGGGILAFSPDGRMIAGGGSDTITLWDTGSGAKLRTLAVRTFSGLTPTIQSLSFSPDGRTLAAGLWGGPSILWDAGSGARLRTLDGGCVAFSPDGRTLASGDGGTIRIWAAP